MEGRAVLPNIKRIDQAEGSSWHLSSSHHEGCRSQNCRACDVIARFKMPAGVVANL
jgi:hypothetical protein